MSKLILCEKFEKSKHASQRRLGFYSLNVLSLRYSDRYNKLQPSFFGFFKNPQNIDCRVKTYAQTQESNE